MTTDAFGFVNVNHCQLILVVLKKQTAEFFVVVSAVCLIFVETE